ncbi:MULTISPECIES: hypothetical protein [Stenotrophomonas]|uniref:Uncharacterized protein n=1 Tax=Stenotrophomonas maltophilia TaxID=40324 RepID=A0A4S2D3U0_STEMA|nr:MULTISPECIES: hypothetical protein [Stenotrophomonas]TGY34944.1 hypothetical protein E5352_08080 [Stenotrophomonas maltophilia]
MFYKAVGLFVALVAFNAGAQAPATKTPAAAVSPGELVSAFRSNPIAAKRRFAGAPIRLQGEVANIAEGKAGGAFAVFGGPWEGYVVDAAISEDAAAKLLPGQHVIFECQSVRAGDLSLGIIHLAGCKRR